MYCSVLQCVAVCCSVLQCVAGYRALLMENGFFLIKDRDSFDREEGPFT